ncbi:LysM peptidoglycan-binding domain-containing protein [Paenibacillus eucommiae]|uniref:LysM domain-containing protein n=1 Tax=Paenibacillus eucommiae TaxID=1355755 RepID=A0ABS4IRL2_9BACL|nr:LysM peptidoglycan-binding domain-containing protein [Paenibacillus eucommiae]MBP1990207.1 hypothetical protein [Paenibacillus eucommiae]
MAEEQKYNGYEIYLSYDNEYEGFRIPILPEEIEVKESGNGKTYEILGQGGGTEETRAGEINVIKNPSLREVSFSGIFPALTSLSNSYIEVKHEIFEPMRYIRFIRSWMASKRPIRFIFIGSQTLSQQERNVTITGDLNFPASIESFDWKEVAGSPGDIEYTLQLKEYVFYSARKAVVKTQPDGEKVVVQQPSARLNEKVVPDKYITQPGDTLPQIAMKFYNQDSSRAEDIRKLNGISQAEALASSLKSGLVLKLPKN